MTDRIEEIFQQVINEDCADPLRRFAELVRQDERARKWIGLTDEEMDYLWGITPPEYQDRFGLARAVEAKLKEKNA